ncbi:DUF4386 family protein [Piscinibacter terrae]|nr:DUF4386 family protein [Albitalea terrae]
MNTAPALTPDAASTLPGRNNASTSRARDPLRGTLLLATALLSLVPVVVLGSSIGWPASLAAPAAQQLAAVQAHAGAVQAGYGAYLLYSLLIMPAMLALASRMLGDLARPLAAMVVAFAALSTLARAIGIARWVTVMPALAAAHASADPSSRAVIGTVFDALTRYGAGIGELLGVSLFMALSLGTLCIGALVQRGAPVLLALSGIAVALLLVGMAAPAFGVPFGVNVAVGASATNLWLLVAGVWAWRGGRG